MRFLIFTVIVLTFMLSINLSSAIESGTILSTEPGTGYKCVYVNLPQDLGITSVNSTSEAFIEADKKSSPWVDTTYARVLIDPGVLNKNPICFSYTGKEEGEFSFYTINIYSKDLDTSSSIFGGLCISSYPDVDTDIEATNKTNVCKLLSENADVIDISFSEDITQAKPSDIITKTLYVTSYATLRIKLSLSTNLQNDFSETIVSTSPSRPTAIKSFKVKAPEREGEFEMKILAEVEDCGIKACKKQKNSIIYVKEGAKKGFSASVIPKNINLKFPSEVVFRVVISNYESPRDFTISVTSDPSMHIEPTTKTITVGQNEEKIAVFSAFPGNESLYKLDFRIDSTTVENEITAYISVGEILNDALRYAAETERIISPNIREELERAKRTYEDKYKKTSYGEDIEAYEDFVNTINEVRNMSGKEGSDEGSGNDATGPPKKKEDGGFNWFMMSIPIIIIAAVILIFFALKKAKAGSSDEYAGFEGYYGVRE